MDATFWQAILLGIVEGLTEFLPVSSTGHLILLIDLLKFEAPKGKVFEITIQLGAILAICWLYRRKITTVILGLPTQAAAQKFTLNLLLAFLPAMVIGVLAHSIIKQHLFSPFVVSVMLILGGIAILGIEKMRPTPEVLSVEKMDWKMAVKIGFFQCLAMIPGTSRSGATIMGALWLGLERKAAAEFSFFLAIPTMFAATAYDLYKNWAVLSVENVTVIALGFLAAFITALIVVKATVAFIGKHGFAPFAYYRIVLGLGMLAMLSL
jgi:undecaprenyl-diphosphatase